MRQVHRGLWLIFVCLLALAGCRPVPDSPEEALRQFLEAEAPEPQLMDPLILRGNDVVPLVVHAIEDRSMKRRLYAILALGNIGERRALPTLSRIALDSSEEIVMREAAVHAMAMIDKTAALGVFPRLEPSAAAELEDARIEIERGETPYRRTYAQARRGEHWP